jgi:hypothetical protein
MKPKVIYYMPFEEYLAIEALSSSAIKTLNVSISDYFEEKKAPTDTAAKSLGRAYHKRILEGKQAFDAAYTIKADKADFLNTVDDLKSFLDVNGFEYLKSAKKEVLTNQVRELGGSLYDDYLANETREFLSQ